MRGMKTEKWPKRRRAERTQESGSLSMWVEEETSWYGKVLDQEIKARSTREVIEATSRTVNLDEEKANEEKLRKLFKEYAGTDEKMDCFELKVVLDCIMRNDKTELENKSSNTAFIWALFRCKTAFGKPHPTLYALLTE
uniref:Uncharacterized protein n=1 Tax=Rhodnius prolixus TaxID=13249 RepID=T1IBD3_RHOPR